MSKLASNKRAMIGETWLFAFFRLMLVVVVALAMVFLVKTFITTEIDITQTQSSLFVYDLLYSDHGISHYDAELGRVVPGLVLVAQFENTEEMQRTLARTFSYADKQIIAAELRLFSAVTKEEIGVVQYTPEWYLRWIVLAQTLWSGPGGATEYEYEKAVLLLYPDGSQEIGKITFSVVMPNS